MKLLAADMPSATRVYTFFLLLRESWMNLIKRQKKKASGNVYSPDIDLEIPI